MTTGTDVQTEDSLPTFADNSEATPEVEEEDASPSPEGEAPDDATEVEEQTLVDELRAQRERDKKNIRNLESDVKAEQGRRKKSETQMQQVQAQSSYSIDLLKTISKQLRDPDAEGLESELASLETANQANIQEQQEKIFTEAHNEAFYAMMELGKQLGHTTPAAVAGDERVGFAMDLFNKAIKRKDPSIFPLATAGVQSVVTLVLASQAGVGAEKTNGAQAVPKAPTNPGRGAGGGMSEKALEAKSASGAPLTLEENQRLQAYWNA